MTPVSRHTKSGAPEQHDGREDRALVPDEISALSLSEIKERLGGGPPTPEIIQALEGDPRRGARDIARSIRLALEIAAEKRLKTEQMSRYESELRRQGYGLIAGCDEAGRGALAGPLVAAAVVLDAEVAIGGLDDSKKLTPRIREALFDEIKAKAICWSVVEISASGIDETGIQTANLRALAMAVGKLTPQPEYVLSDAFKITAKQPVKPLVKGDSLSVSIAAASIIAKVHRDRLMASMHEKYSGYGFEINKGYGTADHMAAIEKIGPSPIHRRSFYPVSSLTGDQLRFI